MHLVERGRLMRRALPSSSATMLESGGLARQVEGGVGRRRRHHVEDRRTSFGFNDAWAVGVSDRLHGRRLSVPDVTSNPASG